MTHLLICQLCCTLLVSEFYIFWVGYCIVLLIKCQSGQARLLWKTVDHTTCISNSRVTLCATECIIIGTTRVHPSSEKVGLGPVPPSCKKQNTTKTSTNTQYSPVLGEGGPAAAGLMTCWGESREEALVPTTLLSTRATITIGAWNVRTMYEAGKTTQVAAEMRRYNITVLGLSETRWLQAGQKRLATGELLLYSGHDEDKAAHILTRSSLVAPNDFILLSL